MRIHQRFLKRFRTRILLLATGLLATAQLVTLAAVLHVAERNLVRQTTQELTTAGRVLQAQMKAREQQLLSSVGVLTSDFGFREAVATGDDATIRSALRNHGERVGADAGLVLGLDGALLAGAGDVPDRGLPTTGLVEQARSQGYATRIKLLNGIPHQLVVVPVNAPLPVAWTALGFRMDTGLARELESLTTAAVSFWAPENGSGYLASTLAEPDQIRLRAALAQQPARGDVTLLELDRDTWYTLRVPLDQGLQTHALLQRPASMALAPYYELRNLLLGVGAATLALSVLGATLLARRVSLPLQTMAHAASRIAGGVYDRPLPRQADEEFEALAHALNHMQTGIAEREERIVHQSSHDLLTGLPNRTRVQEQLEHRLQENGDQAPFALLLMDVDRFREINDSLGYTIGDGALQALAERIRQQAAEGALLARMDGNEFVMLLPGCTRAGALDQGLDLLRRISGPLRVAELEVAISLRGGVCAYPEDGRHAGELLRRAAIALDRSRQNRTLLSLYRPGDDEQHLRRLGLVGDLREAVANDALHMVYQPKVRLADGELIGAEALVRWQHPELGPVPPDEFIALAETTGLIRELTARVLHQAITQCAAWREQVPDFTMAVNLSALDIMDAALPAQLQALLERHALPGDALVLEITESVLMDDRRAARRQLDQLRRLGARLAIDDFGTGYSSLAQLQQLPVQELKIDRGFIIPLPGTGADQAIVRSTLALAHDLGLEVVAEGLETMEAWQLLVALGCEKGQGYGIARPMMPDAFQGWMESRTGTDRTTTRRSH